MRTGINDLNEYLFAQLDRLSNEDMTKEQLEIEINRAKAITNTARTIIENGELALEAKKHFDEYGVGEKISLPFVEDKS